LRSWKSENHIIVFMNPVLLGEIWIRDYDRKDFQVLHEIDTACFPAHMAYSRAELLFFLRHPSSVTRVAEIAGNIVGFAVGQNETGAVAHVVTLDVVPEARRRGAGTGLMNALHEEFRKRHASQVMLEVDAGNEAAQRFYLGLGYERKGFIPGYYKCRGNALVMARAL
jgi:ribosomal-protein-alanine N-acetyltransferase